MSGDDPTSSTSTRATPPSLAKRHRESWENLVDLVASDTSEDRAAVISATNHLTVDTLSALLPQDASVELRAAIQAYGSEFNKVEVELFQPQMSLMEGYHAKPIPIRSSDLFSKNIGSGMRSTVVSGGNTGGDDTQKSNSADTSMLMIRKAASIAPTVLRCAQHVPNASGKRGSNAPSVVMEKGVMLDRLTKDDLWFGSTERLTQGFRRQRLLDHRYARPDFLPIILIPSAPTAAIQLFNVRSFLEEGDYVHPSESYMSSGPNGDTSREDAKPENVVVSPSAFFSAETLRHSAFVKFRVVDDPRKIENWDHVCACIVTGVDWQLQEWFHTDHSMKRLAKPSVLFDYLRGYLAYFEEDKLPQALTQWNVHPLVLNRKYVKAKAHILQAYTFWEELYRFISTNPRFSRYVASGVDEK